MQSHSGPRRAASQPAPSTAKLTLGYAELVHSYAVYLSTLKLSDKGEPPEAAMLQYFVETWRELRRRKRAMAQGERP